VASSCQTHKPSIWTFLLVTNEISGLYYKYTMIVNYASSVVNKPEALLTDNARVVIYDRHVFIVQATVLSTINMLQS